MPVPGKPCNSNLNKDRFHNEECTYHIQTADKESQPRNQGFERVVELRNDTRFLNLGGFFGQVTDRAVRFYVFFLELKL